jgi:hypothetical protein
MGQSEALHGLYHINTVDNPPIKVYHVPGVQYGVRLQMEVPKVRGFIPMTVKLKNNQQLAEYLKYDLS